MAAYLDIEEGGADEVVRLRKIVKALMSQVERTTDVQGGAFSLFQTAIVFDEKVRERTIALEKAMEQLEETNKQLNRANAETETARTRLIEAVESVSEGFALFDEEDHLILCNSKFKEYWGLRENDVPYGACFEELSHKLGDNSRVPEALNDPQSGLEERLQRHQNPKDSFVMRMFDGRWVKVTERPTNDGGLVGVYTDITDIKKQEELRRQEELAEKSILLQASIDNLSQGVAVYDNSYRLVAWNQRFVELLELPADLVKLGLAFVEYLKFNSKRNEYINDQRRSANERLELAIPETPFFFEYERPTGTVLEVQRNPMPNGGFVTTYTDITSRRKAAVQLREAKENLEERVRERTVELSNLNEQLRREIAERREVEEELRLAKGVAEDANLSKTRFLAAASHDLLQPLNAARLFITTLQEKPLARSTFRLVERADLALKGVESLLGALLEISKLDAGAVPVEESEFAVSELLGRLVKEYRPVARETGLELRVVNCTVNVNTDRKLLDRILRNFLSNAVRYTVEGKILVGCRRKGDMLSIEISDTGAGISETDQEEIFEEFHQLKNTAERGAGGVGLGLAIVKRIAETIGVRVRVRSKPGKGSTFRVEIPVAHKSRPTAVPPAVKEIIDMSLGGAHVLVIDNEEAIRAGMTGLLNGWGCEVRAAGCMESVEKIVCGEGFVPDLAIVDYHLDDDVTGIEVLRRMKSDLEIGVPSIIVTADRSEEMRSLVRSEGYALLKKPLEPQRLRAWIAHKIQTEISAL